MEKREMENRDMGPTGMELLDMQEEPAELEEDFFTFVFRRPYKFEGKEYDEIDLSGLERLKTRDLIKIHKGMERSGSMSTTPEFTLEHACLVAARATKLPIEFFQSLPPNEGLTLKNRIVNFLYGGEGE